LDVGDFDVAHIAANQCPNFEALYYHEVLTLSKAHPHFDPIINTRTKLLTRPFMDI